jgi:hypothetical protein
VPSTRRSSSRPGAAPAWKHDEDPPRLVRFAPAQLGRADPFFLHKETGALHPRTPELIEAVAKRVERPASKPGSRWMPRNCSVTRPTSTAR